jgi:F-type H+-transporting ATPase subunit gamma
VPASSKIIRKRIKSVASTKKITRTMEMVATSKLARTQGRVLASRPYMQALRDLMARLGGSVEAIRAFPLFEQRSPERRVLVLLITANRGLCGGYNSNLVRKCREHVRGLEADGKEVILHVCGKKGISALRFLGVAMESTRVDLSDNPTFAEAQALAGPLLDAFLSREVDRVDLVYADFQSLSRQPPVAATLLPVGGEDEASGAPGVAAAAGSSDLFLFDPSPTAILEELGPMFVKNMAYRALLSAVASEQLARRVAMKNATDNANEMEKDLRLAYNKARQAQVTQELAEIVGGAAALE